MKWVKRILLGTVLVVLVAAVLGFVWIRSSLPQTEGNLQLAGLEAPAEVVRDAHGIPHIMAENDRDLARALGFVHAQDRLWQLEMNRRIASGRMAEILGENALPIDRYMRTLSLRDRAARDWDQLKPSTRAVLQAYADGINAYIDSHSGAWPLEFLLTSSEPGRHDPVDSLAWYKVMALDLSGNMNVELARLGLAQRLTSEQIAEFLPAYPGDEDFIAPDFREIYDGLNLAQLRNDQPEYEPSRGSNNWVISGDRTTTGKPFLANDPHLGLTTPNLWYLVHLRSGVRDQVGVSLPSGPGIILGRNNRLAWGFTNTGPDSQDVVIERLAEDGASVQTPEGLAPVTSRTEVIRVKDGEDVTLTVRETPNGPIVTDVVGAVGRDLPDGYELALRWTALQPGDTTANILTGIGTADDFDSFVALMQEYVTPEQNMIYADVEGNIGYYAPGKVPVRSEQNETRGQIPVPGWKPGYDWQGYIPYSELPRRYNPDSGLIATANEKIVDDDYPHYISEDWAPPYRGDRIRGLIRARERHDMASMKAIQYDQYSSIADDLLPPLLAAVDTGSDPRLAALAEWDRVMGADDPEPLMFAAWHRFLAKAVYADELGDDFERYWRQRSVFLTAVLLDTEGQSRWCDDVTTRDVAETCETQIEAAWREASAWLTETMEGPWQDWAWGSVHQAVMEHRPLSQVDSLRSLFEVRVPVGGGSDTVNVANGTFAGSAPHTVQWGASYRVIYDLSDLEKSQYIIPTGQSGNMLSPHYDDMVDLWVKGEYFTIPTDISALNGTRRLRLEP